MTSGAKRRTPSTQHDLSVPADRSTPVGVGICRLVLLLSLNFCFLRAPAAPIDPGHSPSAGATKLPLAESDRLYLANIEQRGLRLSMRGFPALSAAISNAEPSAIARFLSPSFTGQTLDWAQASGPDTPALTIRRIVAAGEPKTKVVAVDSGNFVKYLLDLRNRFAPGVFVEMALKSFAPIQRERIDGPWRGGCLLRLAGRRANGLRTEIMLNLDFEFGRVPESDAIATEAAWVQSFRVTDAQEALAKGELLAEVAKERGIDRSRFQDNWTEPLNKRVVVTGGIYFADVDDDGWEDLLVTDQRGLFLFRNERGSFVDATEKAGLPRHPGIVANALFGDFDGDGLVDLILDRRAFRNAGNFRFEEVTNVTPFAFGITALGLSVGDFDKDGRMDIYVSRSNGQRGSRYSKNSWIDGPGGPGNQLWRNLGNWQFEEVSQKVNAQAGRRSCFTSAWLDANNDGWPDIYVINEFGGGVLLVNNGNGTFKEQPLLDDAGDFGSMGMAVADYDNDGNIDIYTANMSSKSGRRVMENLPAGSYSPEVFAKMKRFVTGSEMYQNMGGLKFARVGSALRVRGVGWAYGAAFADLDNDGWPDLYGTCGFMSVNKEEPDG